MPEGPKLSRPNATDEPGELVRLPVAHERTKPENNLPLQLSSLIGREKERAEAGGLLAERRLLTLTGPGGSGKTRLALAVAGDVADGFEDGVWWVALAPLSDPELVPQAVASVLGVREQPGRSMAETLTDHLASRDMLLVLDNCEHLVEACERLAGTLLSACPSLRVLATSREALGVAGETVLLVPPLSLPGPDHLLVPQELERYEAVRLFVERAGSATPTFGLTERNASDVALLCRNLDGIPLAIELAAARTKVLSVAQISSRLAENHRLLKSASRTADPRQRTLAATLEWSHDLLAEPERALFRRLSVFAGGFTLGAAERVCAGGDIQDDDVLDLLTRLIDKSLVSVTEHDGAEARYRLLETVRQYGQAKLGESGGAEQTRMRHAEYYLALAEEAEPELSGPRQGEWLERLELEHDNLRSALGWALAQDEPTLGLRLGGALGEFWHLHGHLSEGRRWLEAALDRAQAPGSARANAQGKLAWLTWIQGDFERATALNEESLSQYRGLGDQPRIAVLLFTLGVAQMHLNEYDRATALLEEAVTLQREIDDAPGLARTLSALGYTALIQHHYQRAVALHEEGLEVARKAEDDFATSISLTLGALAHLGQGDRQRARTLCEEGFEIARPRQMMQAIAILLHASAALSASDGHPERSARLVGTADAVRETIGSTLTPAEQAYFGYHIDPARSQLGEKSWEAAQTEGRAMGFERAIEYALETIRGTPEVIEKPPAYPAGLSPREVDVLKLMAQGLTNARIAEDLFISPNTVNRHLNSIYHKLGVSSRAAATRFASEHRLA